MPWGSVCFCVNLTPSTCLVLIPLGTFSTSSLWRGRNSHALSLSFSSSFQNACQFAPFWSQINAFPSPPPLFIMREDLSPCVSYCFSKKWGRGVMGKFLCLGREACPSFFFPVSISLKVAAQPNESWIYLRCAPKKDFICNPNISLLHLL